MTTDTTGRDALRELIEDFASHGLRFDLTPTHDMSSRESAERFWHDYFRQADARVRERALAALATPPAAPAESCGACTDGCKDRGACRVADESPAAVEVDALGSLPVEWRWVDEKGRAMTNWKAGEPPPMSEVSDEKGTMRVELRIVATPTPAAQDDYGSELDDTVHALVRDEGGDSSLDVLKMLAHRLDLRFPGKTVYDLMDAAEAAQDAGGAVGGKVIFEIPQNTTEAPKCVEVIFTDLRAGEKVVRFTADEYAALTAQRAGRVVDESDVLARGWFHFLPDENDYEVHDIEACPEQPCPDCVPMLIVRDPARASLTPQAGENTP